MKKHCCSLLVVLLSCLLASCGDDDYRYPSVKQDFLTAFSGMDGRLESVLADEGERLRIVEGASGLRVSADTAVRIVANYETLAIGDGDVAGAKLYALLQTVSPVPLAAAEFEEGVKTEPSEIQSIWRGYDYLNIIVKVKQQGKHLFHFVEDEAVVDENSGRVKVRLTLYHEVSSSVQDYGKRAYLSVPLKQYMTEGVRGVDVRFRIYTYSGCFKTYVLGRSGASCRGRLILYIIYIDKKVYQSGAGFIYRFFDTLSCLYSDAVVMNAVGNCHFNAHFFQA